LRAKRGNRLNFLKLLRAGRDDYVISQAALDYMRGHKLPQATIAWLAGGERRFAELAYPPPRRRSRRRWRQLPPAA